MIAQRLPAHYLELLSDALLKAYWYKGSFRTALRRAGVREGLLATWAAEETKREFWARIMPNLETSDPGIGILSRLADAVAEQNTFPDLERMEDSAYRIRSAKKAISDLNEYRQRNREEAQEQRERRENREKGRKARQETASRQHSLETLSARLDGLAAKIGTPEAGYEFEKWFYDLMDYFEVDNRRPYKSDGRQIDGSVALGGTTYLVELKFTLNQSDAPDIDSFKHKVVTKADNTWESWFPWLAIAVLQSRKRLAIKRRCFCSTSSISICHSPARFVFQKWWSASDAIVPKPDGPTLQSRTSVSKQRRRVYRFSDGSDKRLRSRNELPGRRRQFSRDGGRGCPLRARQG